MLSCSRVSHNRIFISICVCLFVCSTPSPAPVITHSSPLTCTRLTLHRTASTRLIRNTTPTLGVRLRLAIWRLAATGDTPSVAKMEEATLSYLVSLYQLIGPTWMNWHRYPRLRHLKKQPGSQWWPPTRYIVCDLSVCSDILVLLSSYTSVSCYCS